MLLGSSAWLRVVIISLLFSLGTLPVQAEESAPGIPSGAYLQAFFGLGLIILILLAAAFLGRKIWGGKGFGQGGLSIIGGVALSPRERIVLVEAGDTWLVIGIVPGQIRTLHRMPKGTLSPSTSIENIPFAQWLRHFSDKKTEHESTP